MVSPPSVNALGRCFSFTTLTEPTTLHRFILFVFLPSLVRADSFLSQQTTPASQSTQKNRTLGFLPTASYIVSRSPVRIVSTLVGDPVDAAPPPLPPPPPSATSGTAKGCAIIAGGCIRGGGDQCAEG
eukprot:SAG25_NODE_146_length_13831_cov_7.347975_2_plen_128_part_00